MCSSIITGADRLYTVDKVWDQVSTRAITGNIQNGSLQQNTCKLFDLDIFCQDHIYMSYFDCFIWLQLGMSGGCKVMWRNILKLEQPCNLMRLMIHQMHKFSIPINNLSQISSQSLYITLPLALQCYITLPISYITLTTITLNSTFLILYTHKTEYIYIYPLLPARQNNHHDQTYLFVAFAPLLRELFWWLLTGSSKAGSIGLELTYNIKQRAVVGVYHKWAIHNWSMLHHHW